MKKTGLLIAFLGLFGAVHSQLMQPKEIFTKADTLRGSVTKYREGWDVLKYELTVRPDIAQKTIAGSTRITYMETLAVKTMQIDLQQPLLVDSIAGDDTHYTWRQDGNVCFVYLRDSLAMYKIKPGVRHITIWYHGTPRAAVRPPWDGGLVWKTDSLGNPFVGTACQGLGASVWWPCKDYQGDEPDSGMIIHITAPDTLQAISNGRLVNASEPANGYRTWTWIVKNPINNYGVTMNIGKYAHWSDTLMGEGGILDLDYWVLAYNLDSAKKQFAQVKGMIHSNEYWLGKYPFYEDSYKLVEAPFLGMEHQSAVAYGNKYGNGYLGRDLSGTGWGLKWDFIIIHESGHEWFGNNITTKDIADMWVHEGFTNYSETLYTQYMFGKEAGDEYCHGVRKGIKNKQQIIGFYGVNKEGSGDMYPKAANMLHAIRQAIGDDEKFRGILRGLNRDFYHQTVTSAQVEQYISTKSGFDFSKVFDQYLRTIQIPALEYYFTNGSTVLWYRYSNCIKGFNLPIKVNANGAVLSLLPIQTWKKMKVSSLQAALFPAEIDRNYYVTMTAVLGKK